MRIAILAGQLADGSPNFRLCEPDGTICDCWLPGVENPDPEGPLDRGGFDSIDDARGFALGIDRERAQFDLLPGVSIDDIDRERLRLDSMAHLTRLRHAATHVGDGTVHLLLAASMAHPVRRRSRPARAKLSVSQVRAIRLDSRTQVEIAAQLGVTRLTIGNIKRRATWRHVV